MYRGIISIHAPPRGATITYIFYYTRFSHFNSRPSARGDEVTAMFTFYYSISIHAPPRGATSRGLINIWHLLFQFTPLREGRRTAIGNRAFIRKISIHAPPRGATLVGNRATDCFRFQFTPLREGRLEGIHTEVNFDPISIHAPPRGATAKDMQFLQIFCSTLTNQHGLTIVPRNLSRLFW